MLTNFKFPESHMTLIIAKVLYRKKPDSKQSPLFLPTTKSTTTFVWLCRVNIPRYVPTRHLNTQGLKLFWAQASLFKDL